MKKRPVWVLLVLLLAAPAAHGAEADSFDSQPYTEDPEYKTTFPGAPGMVFDVPQDTKIKKVGNSIQVESAAHYSYRKIAEQAKLMQALQAKVGDLSQRLESVERRIGIAERILQVEPEQPADKPLRS